MGYGGTAPNRSVYASGAVAPSGYEKPQSAFGLCAVFLRHIFAVAGNQRFPLSQPQKRHIQPERYAQRGEGKTYLLDNNTSEAKIIFRFEL
jgi:hypothetical protein